MLTYVLLFVIFLCLLHVVFNYNGKARLIRRIPGPPGQFILGHTLAILCPPAELFQVPRKLANAYNGIYGMHCLIYSSVSIYNPEDIEIIASSISHHEKGIVYDIVKPWLQDGLLTSKGTKWQQRRKILTSAFHFNVLKQYFVAIEDNGRHFVEALKKTEGNAVDLIPMLSEYTLNTICETAMGIKLTGDKTGKALDYKKAIYNLGDIMVKRFANIVYATNFVFNLTPLGRGHNKNLSIVHKFTRDVITERRKNTKRQNGDSIQHNSGDSKKRRLAMLDLLMSAEQDGLIDSAGIQEEVDTFMFEITEVERQCDPRMDGFLDLYRLFQGHDTTAAGLTYCLLLLANEPSIQDKIIKEQDTIFGNDNRDATMEDLSQMRYLECCIKESLRLYPPVPFIARHLTQEVTLSNYKVPANSLCCIHIYDLHRREDLYKNATRFDPDRFLPENSVGRHTYAYIPFSAGLRNCIGQKFAMMEMKSALSLIFRNFKLAAITKPSDICFIADLVLRNSGPIYVKFIDRRTS